MRRNTVDILGVSINNITMDMAVEKFREFLVEERVHTIYTPNAEIIMAAQRDKQLKNILNLADLLVADGAGVVLGSKILGRPVPEKVSGIDLAKNSFVLARRLKIKYFLFGGAPGIAEAAAEKIMADYPGAVIVGCRNGYFKDEDLPDIISQINSSEADVLLVALGAPKQEKWINECKNQLNVKICMGVGGTLDILSGKVKLAPEFIRKAGFEWLYRLCKEPWRYKRMLDLPRFIISVLKDRIKSTFFGGKTFGKV